MTKTETSTIAGKTITPRRTEGFYKPRSAPKLFDMTGSRKNSILLDFDFIGYEPFKNTWTETSS